MVSEEWRRTHTENPYMGDSSTAVQQWQFRPLPKSQRQRRYASAGVKHFFEEADCIYPDMKSDEAATDVSIELLNIIQNLLKENRQLKNQVIQYKAYRTGGNYSQYKRYGAGGDYSQCKGKRAGTDYCKQNRNYAKMQSLDSRISETETASDTEHSLSKDVMLKAFNSPIVKEMKPDNRSKKITRDAKKSSSEEQANARMEMAENVEISSMSVQKSKPKAAESYRKRSVESETAESWQSVSKCRGKTGNSRNLEEKPLGDCRYCGYRHVWGKSRCKAFGRTCVLCLKRNHFAAVCRKGKLQAGKLKRCCKEDSDENIILKMKLKSSCANNTTERKVCNTNSRETCRIENTDMIKEKVKVETEVEDSFESSEEEMKKAVIVETKQEAVYYEKGSEYYEQLRKHFEKVLTEDWLAESEDDNEDIEKEEDDVVDDEMLKQYLEKRLGSEGYRKYIIEKKQTNPQEKGCDDSHVMKTQAEEWQSESEDKEFNLEMEDNPVVKTKKQKKTFPRGKGM